ncbi:hypothetical protein SXIM_06490 [Streptomyces xiamenensis]|uniref:Uncharacterized protein n=1 Tax=Streptomyces xiamenensis TaxID=408015 RepID=A0A0F7FPS2_9ACTN|nr:hypothetical protein SXIM_06490 [Streptomyces xiamenensis]
MLARQSGAAVPAHTFRSDQGRRFSQSRILIKEYRCHYDAAPS